MLLQTAPGVDNRGTDKIEIEPNAYNRFKEITAMELGEDSLVTDKAQVGKDKDSSGKAKTDMKLGAESRGTEEQRWNKIQTAGVQTNRDGISHRQG